MLEKPSDTAGNSLKSALAISPGRQVATGEEGEEELYAQRAKLFRMKDGEWKERGTGVAKILKGKAGQVRFLLRQEKTMKIVPAEGAARLRENAFCMGLFWVEKSTSLLFT